MMRPRIEEMRATARWRGTRNFDNQGDRGQRIEMALPPGAIRALQRYPDALVHVLVALLAFGSLAAGQPLATLGIVFLVLGFYFIGRRRAEQAETRSLELKVEAEVAKAEAVKARHIDLLTYGQPNLPLGGPGGARPRRPGSR